MNKYVLDSSAIIAYLGGERGADEVEVYLKEGACISTANWAEVLSKGSDLGQNMQDLEMSVKEHGLNGKGIKFFPVTLADAQNIGSLRPTTKKFGLSLGDRACLALAIRLNLPAVTADRSWLKLGELVEIISVR